MFGEEPHANITAETVLEWIDKQKQAVVERGKIPLAERLAKQRGWVRIDMLGQQRFVLQESTPAPGKLN